MEKNGASENDWLSRAIAIGLHQNIVFHLDLGIYMKVPIHLGRPFENQSALSIN